MWNLSLRRTVLAGSAALMLGGSAMGLAFAQDPPATPTPGGPAQTAPARPSHEAFLAALAQRLGITSEQLQQAVTETRAELGLPEHGPKVDFGIGGHRHGPGWGGLDMSAAAEAIGVSPEQLRQELAGQSLEQVAQAHGVNPADVATALKDAAYERIDQAVAAGRMTAEQATEAKARAAEHIDQHMTKVKPAGGRGHGGRPTPPPDAPSDPT